MLASQVAEWPVGQHRIQVASATVAGRRQLRVSQVDVPLTALDALYLGTLALRRERLSLTVDAQYVLVGGSRPAHLYRKVN